MAAAFDIPSADHDGFWKEAFDGFLPELVHFLVRDVFNAIDWSRGYRPVEAELKPDSHDPATGKLLPDRLYAVFLKSGDAAVLYLHFEFQSQPHADFAERMFAYRVKLFLHLRKPIVSIAILADDDPRFRPDEYRDEHHGNSLVFRFYAVKLLDYAGKEHELLRSGNVAAILVAIKLLDLKTEDPRERFAEKLRVLRVVAALPRGIEVLRRLTRLLIDGMMLSAPLNAEFHTELRRIEAETAMPFTTIYEREARAEGEIGAKQQDILRFLCARFGTVPEDLAKRVNAIGDPSRLDTLIEGAALTADLADFARRLTAAE